MSIEAMKLAAEFNRYFTSSNGVDVPARVSVSRDEWRQLFAALSQQPASGSYKVERHGSGWAIYKGRDALHHGYNLGHLTETTEEVAKLIERGLNASDQQPATPEPVAWVAKHPGGYHVVGYDSHVLNQVPHGTKLYTHPAPSVPDDVIRRVFLEHGFTIKEGQSDLKPYVYAAARALLDAAMLAAKEAK